MKRNPDPARIDSSAAASAGLDRAHIHTVDHLGSKMPHITRPVGDETHRDLIRSRVFAVQVVREQKKRAENNDPAMFRRSRK